MSIFLLEERVQPPLAYAQGHLRVVSCFVRPFPSLFQGKLHSIARQIEITRTGEESQGFLHLRLRVKHASKAPSGSPVTRHTPRKFWPALDAAYLATARAKPDLVCPFEPRAERRSLGSRRLTRCGFGVQSLWFRYSTPDGLPVSTPAKQPKAYLKVYPVQPSVEKWLAL